VRPDAPDRAATERALARRLRQITLHLRQSATCRTPGPAAVPGPPPRPAQPPS